MTVAKRFTCDLCGKTLSTKQKLDNHYEKKVCGDPNEMTEIPPVNKDGKPEEKKDEKPPVPLFPEQKADMEKHVYKCGACRYRDDAKFKKCPSCGEINEFD